MRIAILGAGAIGSTFALHLARAGHEVTVIARGNRLAELERDRAIVPMGGERVPVKVLGALDTSTAYDLVLVTVLAPQVDAVLPALEKSAARQVMFMFNTFEPLARLREAVGAERFRFGFPAILATLDGGALTSKVVTAGQITTVTDAALAEVFTKAGIPSVVHDDMESWLRTHAAMVVPFMVAVGHAHQRKAGLSWKESWRLARAVDEGFGLVRSLGNTITPTPMKVLACVPTAGVAAMLWASTRSAVLRKNGAAGMKEPRALIDAMVAASPKPLPTLGSLPLE